MNKKAFVLVGIFIFTTQLSFAHPPTDIQLQYDSQKDLLLIDIKHLSRDKRKHYIQKIQVTKNEEAPIVNYYRQQVQPNSFYVEIPLTAEENDVITVKAYSRKGGTKEVALELTKEVLEAEIVHPKSLSRSVSTIPQDKSKLRPAVPKDPEISRPTIPTDPEKQRPAVTSDPSVAKPAVTTDPSKTKPAVSHDPDVAIPTIPTDPSKIKPAI